MKIRYFCACGCGRLLPASAGWDGFHGPDFDAPAPERVVHERHAAIGLVCRNCPAEVAARHRLAQRPASDLASILRACGPTLCVLLALALFLAALVAVGTVETAGGTLP